LKSILHFVCFIAVLYAIHLWGVIPVFSINNTIPVIYQHLLLGGFSIIIYLVTQFIAKHYYDMVGFLVLGFLLLKMIFVGTFINVYKLEITEQPILKYIILILYFAYLIFLLIKIVPLINVKTLNKKE